MAATGTTERVGDWPRRVEVVLSRPRYGGNVGAVARAVKNMGLGGMVLAGAEGLLQAEARMMAVGAADVLEAARLEDDLPRALAPYDVVLGVSRRVKSSRARIMTPREAALYLAREHRDDRVALVFGTEDSGLSSEEVSCCHALVSIPSVPDFPSLNLAQAVMVLAYELRMTVDEDELRVHSYRPASPEEWGSMLDQLESVLDSSGFFIRNPRERVMLNLREIFTHGVSSSRDCRLLRGVFRRAQWAINKPEEKKRYTGG